MPMTTRRLREALFLAAAASASLLVTACDSVTPLEKTHK